MRFVIRRASNNQFYFTEEGGNYEKMATSETYTTKASAQHAISVIKREAAAAAVVDQS